MWVNQIIPAGTWIKPGSPAWQSTNLQRLYALACLVSPFGSVQHQGQSVLNAHSDMVWSLTVTSTCYEHIIHWQLTQLAQPAYAFATLRMIERQAALSGLQLAQKDNIMLSFWMPTTTYLENLDPGINVQLTASGATMNKDSVSHTYNVALVLRQKRNLKFK